MRDLALDPVTGDLVLTAGRLRLTEPGPESVAQRLRLRLKLWRGEWFDDQTVGIPYLTLVFGKVPQSQVEALLRAAILSCPGVATLLSFVLTVSPERVASLTFSVRAVDGGVVDINDFSVGAAA